MDPYVGRPVRRLHALVALGAELLRHALRALVLGMDERDDALRAEPVERSARRLGGIAPAPVRAEDRPAELGLRVVSGEVVRGALPRAPVPAEESDTSDEIAVELDDELTDAVALPATDPELDELACGPRRPDPPLDVGVRHECREIVVAPRLPQGEPLSRQQGEP